MSQMFVLRRSEANQAKAIVDNALSAAREMFKQGDVAIEVKPFKKNRTTQQNRYLWALIGLISDETGQDKEDIKDQLMHALGHSQQKIVNGQVITTIKSTTTLTVEEFGELIEATQSLCGGLGIDYPLPSFYGYEF